MSLVRFITPLFDGRATNPGTPRLDDGLMGTTALGHPSLMLTSGNRVPSLGAAQVLSEGQISATFDMSSISCQFAGARVPFIVSGLVKTWKNDPKIELRHRYSPCL